MKLILNSLSATKGLAGMVLLFSLSAGLQAAATISLSGTTDEVKYESNAEVRVSLIDWSSAEQLEAVEAAYRHYRENKDLEGLLAAIDKQDTRGYLFSAAATGYRIKYAWKNETDSGQMMHFLVTPGLKTRNPYLWKTPNNSSPGFTLLQVQLENESGVAKTSIDGNIIVNEQGNLQLEAFNNLPEFARLEDSTPYYLK